MLKLVPFKEAWIGHDKIDLHAIYRRPRFVQDQYGEFNREYDANGVPTWDLTGALPVKSHNRWRAKGFEYVTLADRASLQVAAKYETVDGDWKQYDQHQTGGPWNYKRYQEGQSATITRESEQLRADVEQFGSAAVEAIRRQREPDFALPPHLSGIPPGGKVGAPIETKAPDLKLDKKREKAEASA